MAGASAVIGLLVAPLQFAGSLDLRAVALGLTLFGLFGTMVAPFRTNVWDGTACLAFPGI